MTGVPVASRLGFGLSRELWIVEVGIFLNMLGYDYSAPVEGRREALDKGGIKELLKPRLGASAPASATPKEETPPADMPK